jgi:hypothetical protein
MLQGIFGMMQAMKQGMQIQTQNVRNVCRSVIWGVTKCSPGVSETPISFYLTTRCHPRKHCLSQSLLSVPEIHSAGECSMKSLARELERRGLNYIWQ